MKAIVCTTTDGSIGRNGDQLYYISDDLTRFKKLTEGQPIFMGINTFYALPKKPLLNRVNIILSNSTETGTYFWKDNELQKNPFGDIIIVNSLEDIPENSWCIGGGLTYKNALPYIDEIYITEVQQSGLESDVKFPALSLKEWDIYDTSEILTDPKTGIKYKYRTAKRK